MHITKAYIPSDIAKSLVKYPLLIQKAVETFYTRDAIQLRVRLNGYQFAGDITLTQLFRLHIVCPDFRLVRRFLERSK